MDKEDDMNTNDKGQSLRERREELGVTREALANALGTHLRTISRWELGEVAVSERNYARAIRTLDTLESGEGTPLTMPSDDLGRVPLLALSRELTRRLALIDEAQRGA